MGFIINPVVSVLYIFKGISGEIIDCSSDILSRRHKMIQVVAFKFCTVLHSFHLDSDKDACQKKQRYNENMSKKKGQTCLLRNNSFHESKFNLSCARLRALPVKLPMDNDRREMTSQSLLCPPDFYPRRPKQYSITPYRSQSHTPVIKNPECPLYPQAHLLFSPSLFSISLGIAIRRNLVSTL
jgi:hypothetical protein